MSGVSNRSSIYQQLALAGMARALSMQDANPRSRTYGCCDRSYWHYRTLTSFPAGTFQQLALPFAVLHLTAFEGNPYSGGDEMLARAKAAMMYWARVQHRDGSLDEWYRNERSYCATAFTTFGIGEAALELRRKLDRAELATEIASVGRAAAWLARHFNEHVMNQNIAACAALWNAYELTGDDQWRRGFQSKWARTLEHFDEEGWFSEYGGADPGYATLALDVLATMDRRGCDANVGEVAARMCAFLASLAGAGGGVAERLGSRGTAHAFPFGIAHFARTDEHAAQLHAHLRREYEHGTLLSPAVVDDRYLAYFYLPSFALACTVTHEPAFDAARSVATIRHLPRSGLVIHRAPDTTAKADSVPGVVVSLRRQGAFNWYEAGRPVLTNLGYWAETAKGERWSSSFWNDGVVDALVEGDRVMVKGTFTKLKDSLPLAGGSVLFTIVAEWILRIPGLSGVLHEAIKRRRIVARRSAPLEIERELCWRERRLRVRDTITRHDWCPVLKAIGPVGEIDVHSPSSHMQTQPPMRSCRIDEPTAAAWANAIGRERHITLEFICEPGQDGTPEIRRVSDER